MASKKKRKPFTPPATAIEAPTSAPTSPPHHVAFDPLGNATGPASDAELEPDDEHDAKSEEP